LKELTGKFKEVLTSVLPITFIVLALHFTISPLELNMLYAFLIGSALVIIGLTIFLFGINQGLEPIGHGVGNTITHSKYGEIISSTLLSINHEVSLHIFK
jgi:hypothetical protein